MFRLIFIDKRAKIDTNEFFVVNRCVYFDSSDGAFKVVRQVEGQSLSCTHVISSDHFAWIIINQCITLPRNLPPQFVLAAKVKIISL